MNTPLRETLGPGDQEHLRSIFDRGATAVEAFLRDRTFLEEPAAAAFRGLGAAERERLLSELVWRLACFLEGSQTATAGTNCYELSSLFSAVVTEEVGGALCTLVLNEAR